MRGAAFSDVSLQGCTEIGHPQDMSSGQNAAIRQYTPCGTVCVCVCVCVCWGGGGGRDAFI